MLRALSCLLSLSAVVVAQDPAARCAEALLRGDREAAARAAAAADNPALRARLQAALVPLAQRPAAMLAVAGRFPGSPEADAAILAGAAAVLALRDRGRAVPGLMAWLEQEDSDEPDVDELQLGPVVEGLWQVLEGRMTAPGEGGVRREAKRLLAVCSVSRFGFQPCRVLPAATWTLPERREDLRLRAFRRQPGRGSWDEFDAGAAPVVELLLPQAANAPVPGLGAGDWLVELQSTTTCWRGLRAVEVSALDIVALVDDGALVLGAWRTGKPAVGTDWLLRHDGRELAHGAFAGGVTVVWPGQIADPSELLVKSGGNSAWARMPYRNRREPWRDRWQAHVMLDRPLYRPGETALGRVVLRRCNFEGEGVDTVAHTEAAPDQAVTVRATVERGEVAEIHGATDAHGVFLFELPLPATGKLGDGSIAVEVRGAAGPEAASYDGDAFEVANFRRPVLQINVTGPEEVAAGAADPQVVLHAAWASGAPASGIPVTAKASTWHEHDTVVETHALVTDALGCATVTVPLRQLEDRYVSVEFAVQSPDGRTEHASHRVLVKYEPPAGVDAADPEPGHRWLEVRGPDIATVGQPCRARIEGAACALVLFVAGRGHGARAQLLQLDDHGEASVEVTPTRAEWPVLDLAVATSGQRSQTGVPLQLREPTAPRIDLPVRCKPGEAVSCRIATGVAGTIVTVAVVDERIFAIAPEQTKEPNAVLRPAVPQPSWGRAASAPTLTSEELLGSMLENGRVPATDYRGSLDPLGPPSAGAGMAGPATAGEVRVDFRATAAFVTAIAGADGTAVVPFTLPDDLTTWRVSIVGIAPDGIGFQERRALATRLPLAAEPLLPRVLRHGDQVATPVTIDRAATATGGGDAVTLAASSDGSGLEVRHGDVQLGVPAGSAATALVTLRGVAAGEASLSLTATLGEVVDRSRRALPVQRDAIPRPLPAIAAMGSGRIEVGAPAGAEPEHGLDVVVLGGGSAAWREIERRLTAYPYGCVEQTLSRLLPYFAARRGARVHGVPPPVTDAGMQQRIDGGMQRLRQLQQRRGGGFSFWPGGDVDAGMTVLVLHGLASVSKSGVDPATYGLVCDPQNDLFADACKQLAAQRGVIATAADVMAAELAAACLRSVPGDAAARAAVSACIDAGSTLPAGLLLRIGLSLCACGDADRAARCLSRLDGMQLAASLSPDGFPGEDPLAVQALRLELHLALHPDLGAASNLTSEVLLQCLHGYSSTYAQACALTALALALPPATVQPVAVQVTAGDVTRSVELTAANHFTAQLHMPFASRCSVSGPAGRQLLLRVTGVRSERASDHAAWQSPIGLERALCRQLADATAEQRRQGEHLVPIGSEPPRLGEVLWLRVRVQAPMPMRYVVVECPLPAGFELPEEPPWLERFDDRVAFCFASLGSEPQWRALPVVPTMTGTVVWPPAVAQPMYVAGCDGGCAGSVLAVAAGVASVAGESTVTAFLQWPAIDRDPPPSVWQQADAAADQLRESWPAADDAGNRAAIDAALAELVALATRDHDNLTDVLSVVTELGLDLQDEDDAEAALKRDPASLGRRRSLLLRVQLVQQQLAMALGDEFEQPAPERTERERLAALMPALAGWPDVAERERRQARVLHALAQRRSALVVEVIQDLEGKATTASLRTELLRCFGTASQQARACIIDLLPRADLSALPPALLVESQVGEWSDDVIEVLLSSPAGCIEVQRCLQQDTFLLRQLGWLSSRLPAGMWRQVPLAAYAELASRVDSEDLSSEHGFDLVARLAGSPIASAALQQELRETQDIDWRIALLQALRQRGVRDLGGAIPDYEPTLAWWARALALPDEPAAVSQFLAELQASPSVVAAYGDHGANALRRSVLPTLVERGTAEQLAAVGVYLDEAPCKAVFARLDAAGRRAVIDAAWTYLDALPTPLDTADCESLWSYGVRCQDLRDVTRALCRSDVGVDFVRARIEQDRARAEKDKVVEAFAKATGLDEDTLLPSPEEPWRPLLHTAARRGLQHVGTPAEQQLLEAVRRQRGVW